MICCINSLFLSYVFGFDSSGLTIVATVEAWLDKIGVFPIDFAQYYGIRNLSPVIFTLVSRGWEIELVNDEFGKGTHYRKKN